MALMLLARGGVGCGGMLVVQRSGRLCPAPSHVAHGPTTLLSSVRTSQRYVARAPLCTNKTSVFREHLPMSSKWSCAKLSSQCLAMNFASRPCIDWSIKCACSPAPYPWLRAESHAGQRRCTGEVNAHQVVGMVAIRPPAAMKPPKCHVVAAGCMEDWRPESGPRTHRHRNLLPQIQRHGGSTWR